MTELVNGICKGCGKKVIFAKDTEGKTQILDPSAPTYAVIRIEGETVIIRRSSAFVSHFATCPKADQFSKSRKRDPGQGQGRP